jgi:hypothetical protein
MGGPKKSEIEPEPGESGAEAEQYHEPGPRTRSGRQVRATTRMRESRFQWAKKWVTWIVNVLPTPPELSEEDEQYEIFDTGSKPSKIGP